MPREDSRQKIVAAARRAFYERGYDDTSFAQIAGISGVPKGNFYYHFPSKAELLQAVLEARRDDIGAALTGWEEELPSPKARLARFVRMMTNEADALIRYGCPVGSLLTELGKANAELHAEARAPLDLYVDWIARQLVAGGKTRKAARELALRAIARAQGAILTAHAYGDADLLKREAKDIERWLTELVA